MLTVPVGRAPPMRRSPRALTICAAVLLVTAAACSERSTFTPGPPSIGPPNAAPSPKRPATASKRSTSSDDHEEPLVVIFMENHERSQVVGSSSAPFQNSMRRHGRDYTNYFAITHPSLPNYLAFASGSTNGKTTDDIAAGQLAGGPTLWDQLSAAKIDWAVYQQDMPSPCFGGGSAGPAPGDYALKHNPATPFGSVYHDPSDCSNVLPLSAMDPAHLPTFSFITPNECNDAHSCSMETADEWLADNVPRLVAAGADVLVTYDEGTTDRGPNGSTAGGQVFAVEVGRDVRAGTVVSHPLDHYSLLAGIEQRFGLRKLQEAADAATMPT